MLRVLIEKELKSIIQSPKFVATFGVCCPRHPGEHQQVKVGCCSQESCGGPGGTHLSPATPGQADSNAFIPDSLVQGEIPVLADAAMVKMTQVGANLLRHGSQQADVQRAGHGIVNLAQP